MKWEVSHQSSRKELHLSPGTNRCGVEIKRKAISVRLFLTGGGEKTKVFWCFVKYSWLTVSNVGVLAVWRFYTDAKYYTASLSAPPNDPPAHFSYFVSFRTLSVPKRPTWIFQFWQRMIPSCLSDKTRIRKLAHIRGLEL